MAKSFVLNDFVRHLDPMLVEAYLARHKLPLPTVPTDTSPKLVEAILQRLHTLPPKLKIAIETDFSLVNELATYSAQTILLDLAQMKQVWLPAGIAEMTQYDVALWFFLHEPTVFAQVLRDYELEDIVGWREFVVPKRPQPQVRNRTEAFQAALQTHLMAQEHRGANCLVEYYRKGNTSFYIAYPEDYTKVKISYTGPQQLNKQVCKPVQRIYFRYESRAGILSIKGFRSLRKLEAYRAIFCQTVLDNQPSSQKRYLCNLALLTDPRFHLTCGPDIDRLAITSVVITPANRTRSITLDFNSDAPANIAELHHQLHQLHLPLEHLTILRIKFCFKFKASVSSQGRNSVTCYLAAPNAHNLADKPLHQRVMAYFKQWGLYDLATHEAPPQPPQP